MGTYKNYIWFLNQYDPSLVDKLINWLSDVETGSTKRSVKIHVTVPGLSAPEMEQPSLFAPTIVDLTWSYPDNESKKYLSGYRIVKSTNQSDWEEVAVITDINQTTYRVANLFTGMTYYFQMDAYGDDVQSPTSNVVEIEIPMIEPEGDCRAFFTGAMISDHQTSGISEIYVLDNWSEYVGAGKYPNNSIAFPKAVASTFDGIAIDAGTKVTLYSQPNFQGEILYEKVGPAVIGNVIWKGDSRYDQPFMGDWKEPLQSNYPQSVREWSEYRACLQTMLLTIR